MFRLCLASVLFFVKQQNLLLTWSCKKHSRAVAYNMQPTPTDTPTPSDHPHSCRYSARPLTQSGPSGYNARRRVVVAKQVVVDVNKRYWQSNKMRHIALQRNYKSSKDSLISNIKKSAKVLATIFLLPSLLNDKSVSTTAASPSL